MENDMKLEQFTKRLRCISKVASLTSSSPTVWSEILTSSSAGLHLLPTIMMEAAKSQTLPNVARDWILTLPSPIAVCPIKIFPVPDIILGLVLSYLNTAEILSKTFISRQFLTVIKQPSTWAIIGRITFRLVYLRHLSKFIGDGTRRVKAITLVRGSCTPRKKAIEKISNVWSSLNPSLLTSIHTNFGTTLPILWDLPDHFTNIRSLTCTSWSAPKRFPSSLTELVFRGEVFLHSLGHLTCLRKLDLDCTTRRQAIPWNILSPNLTYLDLQLSPIHPIGPFPLLERYCSLRVAKNNHLAEWLGEKLTHLSFYLPNDYHPLIPMTNRWPNLTQLNLKCGSNSILNWPMDAHPNLRFLMLRPASPDHLYSLSTTLSKWSKNLDLKQLVVVLQWADHFETQRILLQLQLGSPPTNPNEVSTIMVWPWIKSSASSKVVEEKKEQLPFLSPPTLSVCDLVFRAPATSIHHRLPSKTSSPQTRVCSLKVLLTVVPTEILSMIQLGVTIVLTHAPFKVRHLEPTLTPTRIKISQTHSALDSTCRDEDCCCQLV